VYGIRHLFSFHPPPRTSNKGKVMPHPSGTDEKLTVREIEVLRLVVNGLSTKQIARSLDISFKTAAFHRMRIMEKLKVSRVADLTHWAMQNGYLATPSNRRASERQQELFDQVKITESRYRKAMDDYGAFIRDRETIGLTNPDGATGARRLRQAEEMAHNDYQAALIALKNFLFREIN
jgi:DNA-binding CsgD family transcriptional regulator